MPFRHADGTHALFDLGQVKLRVRRVSVLRRPTIRPMADAGIAGSKTAETFESPNKYPRCFDAGLR